MGQYIEDKLRQQLIYQLAAYQKKRGHSIILVFDGGTTSWPAQEKNCGVCVVYPGFKKTADEYIKNYITEFHGQDLLLVSSDRELNLWANKYDIVSLDSISFFKILNDTLTGKTTSKQKKTCTVKTTSTEDPFLDALMQDSTKHIPLKDEDRPYTTRTKQGKEIPKIERILRKKLEKL